MLSDIRAIISSRLQLQQHVQELHKRLTLIELSYAELNLAYDQLNADRNRWKWMSERLQLDHDYVAERRAKGHMFEFDYSYSPRKRNWDQLPRGNLYRDILEAGEAAYSNWISAAERYVESFRYIDCDGSPDATAPFWSNGWFAPLDAICLYTLLAENNPKYYFEVGSGNSTKFARQAVRDHSLQTRIISIDPHPRAVIDDICDEIIRSPLEHCDLGCFNELRAGDLLFIDNSHRSFQGSDVTVFFTEVLPTLHSGVMWGVHDIFLPRDYPESWAPRMYNEQYLLMTYLLGGARGDTVELPVAHLAEQTQLLDQFCKSLLPDPPWREVPLIGGAFWMRKA